MISIEFRISNTLEGKLPESLITRECHYVLALKTYEASQMVVGYRARAGSPDSLQAGLVVDEFGILNKNKITQAMFRLMDKGAVIEKINGKSFSGTASEALEQFFAAAEGERCRRHENSTIASPFLFGKSQFDLFGQGSGLFQALHSS